MIVSVLQQVQSVWAGEEGRDRKETNCRLMDFQRSWLSIGGKEREYLQLFLGPP